MKKIILRTVISSIILVFFTDCFKSDKDIELSLRDKPKMVLFSSLEGSDNYFEMFLTRTNEIGKPIKWDFNRGDTIFFDPFDPKNISINSYLNWDTVKNPRVQLFENDSLIVDNLPTNKYLKGSYFKEDLKPFKENKIYTIKVSALGFDTISASQKIPPTVKLKNLVFNKDVVRGKFNERLSEIVIEFDDPVGLGNYYLASASIIDTFFNKEIPFQLFKIDPIAVNDNLISDNTFDGKTFKWRMGIAIGVFPESDDRYKFLRLKFRTVTSDYVSFAQGVEQTNRAGENPFVEPFNIYTNVKNGYGVFNITGRSTIIEINFK